MKHAVFLTRILPTPVMQRLRILFDLTYNARNRPLTKQELIRGIRGKQALISMLSDTVDAEVIARADHLKVIANYAAGYNNIDLAAASSSGIIVTNTPGVLTDATADLTWSLILSLVRRVLEGDRLVRSGKWSGWAPTQLLGTGLSGKTLGIIGMGRIGRAVVQRAAGFGMRLVYHSRRRLAPRYEKKLRVSYRSLSRLLSIADIVSLHVPFSPGTYHLLNRPALGRMKPTAFLINTSRGPVVDEKALAAALRKRKIAGAGLDVYEREPKIQKGLLTLSNIVLLPHLGSATLDTRIRMGQMVIQDIQAVLNGKTAPRAVNEL